MGAVIGFDIALTRDGARGSIEFGGQTYEVLRAGESFYVRADREAYLAQPGGERAADLLGGRWVVTPASSASFGGATSLTDLGALADSLLDTSQAGLRTGDTSQEEGREVIELLDESGGSFFVATSDSRPVRVRSGANGIAFTDYDAPVDLTPPPDPVDPSTLGLAPAGSAGTSR